jgi:hypothetical protein
LERPKLGFQSAVLLFKCFERCNGLKILVGELVRTPKVPSTQRSAIFLQALVGRSLLFHGHEQYGAIAKAERSVSHEGRDRILRLTT